MARARRTSDASNIRIFRTESGSELAELDDIGFGDEDQLHRLIESNIGTLFRGLTFLRREFRELDGGQHIPDTVAFDKQQNTFVVIEYKNKLDRGVIDQAKAYLKYMKKNRHALMVEYVKSEGDGVLDLASYNWDVYAIIMAPEFSRNQIDSAEADGDLELHEIRWYGGGTMTARRVGGAHERAQAAASAPSPGAGAPQAQAAARAHNRVSNVTQTNQLYDTIRARLLDEFPGAEETKKKFYNGFRYPGGKYFCTIALQKSKIGLAYSGKRAASKLKPDDFVREVDGWGVGKFRSEIKNEADFEKALAILKRLHAADRSEHASPTPQQASGTRVFPDELLKRAWQPQRNWVFRRTVIAVRPYISDGDRTVLTFGGIDAENHIGIVQQATLPDSFSEVTWVIKWLQDKFESIASKMPVIVPVDITGTGAALLDVLRENGISGCVEFKRTDGRMDVSYIELRTVLETDRVFIQEADSPYRDELFAQLRGISRSGDGTMKENKGSDRAASLAIAVWGARQTGGQGGNTGSGIITTDTPGVFNTVFG